MDLERKIQIRSLSRIFFFISAVSKLFISQCIFNYLWLFLLLLSYNNIIMMHIFVIVVVAVIIIITYYFMIITITNNPVIMIAIIITNSQARGIAFDYVAGIDISVEVFH